MDLATDQFSFGDHAYRRFCEKIKDAVDPNGILSPESGNLARLLPRCAPRRRPMTKRLEDKVALITGTASGQGRAAAIRFAAKALLVVGCDLSEQAEPGALVQANGGAMSGMAPVDLSDPEQARAWVEAAAAVHGRVDIVYNNASGPRFGSMADLSVEDWQAGMRNELDLVFYVTKFAWPYLAKHGGVVITTGSTSAYLATPKVGMAAHSAAKGGVVALSRVFATDGAPVRHPRRDDKPRPDQDPGTRAELPLEEGSRRRGDDPRQAPRGSPRHARGRCRSRGVRGLGRRCVADRCGHPHRRRLHRA